MNGTDSRLDARLDAPAARAAGDMADKDGLEQNDSQDHCFAQSDSDGAVSEGDGPIWMQLDGPSRSALPTPIAPLTNRPPAGQMQIASDNYLDSVLSFHPQSMCQAPGQRESYIGGAVPISQQHRATCDDFSSPLTSSDFEQVVHSIFAHPRHTNDLLFPSYYQFTLGNDGPTGLTALEGWNFLGANDQTVAAPDEFAKSTNDSLSTLPSLPDILTSNEKFARADSGQSSWMSLSSTEFEPGLASFLPNLPDQLFIENSSNVASKYFNNLTGLLGAFSSEYFQPGNHCSNTDSLTVDCDTTFEQEEIISPASTYHSLSNGLPAIQDYLVNSQVAVSSVTYQGRNYFVDDYIAVESADGTEFYGIIIAFVGTGEKERAEKIPDDLKRTVSFVMQWLLPDKERFQNALLEGRDLVIFVASRQSPSNALFDICAIQAAHRLSRVKRVTPVDVN
ncbi:hypothetical protein DFJ73DRAFT_809406 [Zopfochytrium polystomum]|nr:hypothetical protein DFJ73DRAFT_809406 [Zopfochytrium polystomum]